jgi:hypothetical protein
MAELGGVRNVVVDTVQTSVWYAAAMGRSVTAIADTPIVCKGSVERDQPDLTRRRWSELLDGVEGSRAQSLGEEELGRQFMMSPDQLAVALGWDDWKRQLAARAFSFAAELRYGSGPRSADQPDTPEISRTIKK